MTSIEYRGTEIVDLTPMGRAQKHVGGEMADVLDEWHEINKGKVLPIMRFVHHGAVENDCDHGRFNGFYSVYIAPEHYDAVHDAFGACIAAVIGGYEEIGIFSTDGVRLGRDVFAESAARIAYAKKDKGPNQ